MENEERIRRFKEGLKLMRDFSRRQDEEMKAVIDKAVKRSIEEEGNKLIDISIAEVSFLHTIFKEINSGDATIGFRNFSYDKPIPVKLPSGYRSINDIEFAKWDELITSAQPHLVDMVKCAARHLEVEFAEYITE